MGFLNGIRLFYFKKGIGTQFKCSVFLERYTRVLLEFSIIFKPNSIRKINNLKWCELTHLIHWIYIYIYIYIHIYTHTPIYIYIYIVQQKYPDILSCQLCDPSELRQVVMVGRWSSKCFPIFSSFNQLWSLTWIGANRIFAGETFF